MKVVSVVVLVLCAVVEGRQRAPSLATATELRTLSEELLSVDAGLPQPSISVQGKTTAAEAADKASQPLISSVPASALGRDTVRLMRQLLDNYIPLSTQRESYTNAEKQEEGLFLDAIVRTPVMQTLEAFLRRKNLLSGTLRAKLKEMWFQQYRRGSSNIGSSGFEHVFVGELKGGKVSGFHNWLNMRKEEQERDLDYKGYMRVVNLSNKGKIVKMRFVWMNKPKPVGSMFIGTTPELEIALYTACFLTKMDQRCPVQLANQRFNIQTWSTSLSRGRKVIGSAYPEI